jgi:carbon dioxide concentrating mechanism protein CcmN
MPLSLPLSLQYREANVIGDVQVDALAMIAPGVLLYAEPGCQIRVGAGVCLGMGCVIHARGGDIEIAAGASVGTGVLIWGAGQLGSQACIGANSTLIHPQLDALAVVAPASLVGDASRQVTVTATVTVEKTAIEQTVEKTSVAVTAAVTTEVPILVDPASADPTSIDSPTPKAPVLGKDYVQQMMGRMFPGQADFNGNGDGASGARY